jgi:hypothetical protein
MARANEVVGTGTAPEWAESTCDSVGSTTTAAADVITLDVEATACAACMVRAATGAREASITAPASS